jgi:hypothetical protein
MIGTKAVVFDQSRVVAFGFAIRKATVLNPEKPFARLTYHMKQFTRRQQYQLFNMSAAMNNADFW